MTAVTQADHVRATLRNHEGKVSRALDVIARAGDLGAVGISFSGGKDSTVLLDLVRQVFPDAPAAFFDSGCEMDATRTMVSEMGVETFRSRLSIQEIARFCGWWGYADPVDPDCGFDLRQVLVDEPSETFVVRHRLSVVAIGLRGAESRGRKMNAIVRGELYQAADRTWRLCPLGRWSDDDIWAYIASRGLRYHPAYDAMTARGLPRKAQRVGVLLGGAGATIGRYVALRWSEPETWRRLVAEFPAIGVMS